jgi:hypothetical protein
MNPASVQTFFSAAIAPIHRQLGQFLRSFADATYTLGTAIVNYLEADQLRPALSCGFKLS